jgi:lipopolysaccharide export LptBFGC system permease protein LptF
MLNVPLKLMDRYVLVLFIKNYLISLTVLIGMYVVMDMVLRFDDIVRVEKEVGGSGLANVVQTLEDVGAYYWYRCFVIFTQMSGVIPVVAAAFTLMRLSRFNELTAFLAAGIPMLRLVAPVILAALVLNGLLIVDQELILPSMIPQLMRSHDEMHQANGNEFPITAMQVDQHSVLVAGLYYPNLKMMRDMDLVERTDDLMPKAHLRADSAQWNPKENRWDLSGGRYVSNLLHSERATGETPVPTYSGTLTPDEIDLYHGSEAVEFLSTSKINQLLARPKSYGASGLNKIKNLRLTQPFMNVVLLLLAVPSVLTFDPKTLKTAATKCLVLMGLAMSSVFICQQIAGKPPLGPMWVSLWPALMSWMPIFIFAPLAVFLMDRVKT